jgi:hypothetical protein
LTDGRNTIGQAILDGYDKNVAKYVQVSTDISGCKAVVTVMRGYGE